jgi:hypothetical protein
MDIHTFFQEPDGLIKQPIQNNIKNLCNFELTEEQEEIIFNDPETILVNGVPGSAKTTTLVLRLVNKLYQSQILYNIILFTKVSNVTEEVVKRLTEYLPKIKITYTQGSRVTAEYNGHILEFSNYDAFVHSQLQFYQGENNYLEYKNKNGEIQKKKLGEIGGRFEFKKRIFNQLVNNKKITTFKLKNGNTINKIIADEVQDFSQTVAIVFFSMVKNNNKISFEGYGDILQSIWYAFLKNELTNKYNSYPIKILKTIENIKLYPLSKCFRCPFYHCEFLKIINKKANKEYNREEIQSQFPEPKEPEEKHKIMHFEHGPIGRNEDSEEVAEKIYAIVKTVMEYDKDITFGDIVVIAPNINTNLVMEKLNSILKEYKYPVVFFKTKSGDITETIDMNKLKEDKCSRCRKKFNKKSSKCKKCYELRKINKIALISGHGFKGGERKCVIAFSISELSIPKHNHPGTPNELNDKSLLNVICSRSTKYLFLGSNHSPSRYITNHMDKLSNVLYLVQDFSKYLKDKATQLLKDNKVQFSKKIVKLKEYYDKGDIKKIKNLKMRKKKNLSKQDKEERKNLEFLKNLTINDIEKPEIYTKVSEKLREHNKMKHRPHMNSPLDNLIIKKETRLKTPDKSELTVTNIVEKSDEYESLNDILEVCVNITTETFGEPCHIDYINVTSILGNLPNIRIDIAGEKEFFKCLTRIINNENVEYVIEAENQGFFNILKDNLKWRDFLVGIDLEKGIDIIMKNNSYKNVNGKLQKSYQKNLYQITKICRNGVKQILLPSYFKGIFTDMELEDNTKIFNMCLLYDFMYSPNYTQCSYKINNDNEYFTGELDNAMKNIDSVISKLKDIKIEIPCKGKIYIEKDTKILKKLLFNERLHDHIFRKGYPLSIDGRIDGYIHSHLYEFKMSLTELCKKSWKLQVLIYCYLGIEEKIGETHTEIRNFRTAILYNFMRGEKYTFEIDLNKFKQDNIKKLFDEVLDKFNFMSELKKNFLPIIIN